MTSPSQEQLLGYLLGALEPGEHEQFERELAASPELQQQLERISCCLEPLDATRMLHEPPPGLAARTCSFVFEHLPQEATVSPARRGVAAAMSADASALEYRSSWSMADMVVAAGIFLAAGMLFFPAIANSRFQAQIAQCQNNLRQVGYAMIDYSGHNPKQEYPPVSLVGNRAVAGIQAAYLTDQGYLERPGSVFCPATLSDRSDAASLSIPSLPKIDAARGEELAKLQRQVGGSTAFPLGYQDRGKLKCAKNQHRSNYPLASDAPSGAVPNMVSNHHGGQAQNVVFEDGRVEMVTGCGTKECGDPLFWNRENRVEAGICPDDIVLAPSGTPPMSRVVGDVIVPDMAP